MLGISDTRSTSHLSKQTGKPAYYIVDCRILGKKSSADIFTYSITKNFHRMNIYKHKYGHFQ